MTDSPVLPGRSRSAGRLRRVVCTFALGIILPGAILLLACVASSVTADEPAAQELAEPPLTEIDYEHWAFQPVQPVDLPAVTNSGWCRTPVDRFILAELERSGVAPVQQASQTALLRRVTFDLTGLPPRPEEIRDYLTDTRPDAYERVVDRLLASPAYGERWARGWLDLARFAETDGFEHDHVRPQAWRYRDWVIHAGNADLPYDQFLSWQLAGDELHPQQAEALVATGFLLCGPDMPDINLQEERRHNFLNGVASTVGEVFLALQFGCAQCHDHKADPISIHDFYRLRAYFDSLDLFEGHSLDGEEPGDDNPALRIVRAGAEQVISRVAIRGDFRRPGPTIAPAVPRVTRLSAQDELVPTRSDLAAWMCDSRNPLAARVIANRLWQHHFGVGLCSTSSDFGLMGDTPSHPELLDWLATRLIDHGWSLKQLHRLLVTSATYRLASLPDPADRSHWDRLLEEDPDNLLLGRMHRRRLDAEEIRDALLAVGEGLNREPGGPGVQAPLPPEVRQTLLKNQWQETDVPGADRRRSIYLFARRNLRYPLLEVFDQPDSNQSCPRRTQTTIAPQALSLMNSEFSWRCARDLAVHCRSSADLPPLQEVYLRTLGRLPSDEEQQAATRFLDSGGAGEQAWTELCLALLNQSEFLYID